MSFLCAWFGGFSSLLTSRAYIGIFFISRGAIEELLYFRPRSDVKKYAYIHSAGRSLYSTCTLPKSSLGVTARLRIKELNASLTIFQFQGILKYMQNPLTDPNFQYAGVPLGRAVRGTMGGTYEKLTSDPRAKNPFYWHRITAEYYFQNTGTEQKRFPWILSDPTGANIPATYKNQFKARVLLWHGLSQAQKESYNTQARLLPYHSGFNYFMSLIKYT